MQRNMVIRILVFMLIAVFMLNTGCGSKKEPVTPEETEAPAESTLPSPKNEDIIIETPYCTLSIPYTFSELVAVERDETEAADSYIFSAVLGEQNVPVYTIRFTESSDGVSGNLFGTLKAEGGSVRVFYEAFSPDDSIQEEDLEAFYSAQETINDIFASIKAAPGFTAE